MDRGNWLSRIIERDPDGEGDSGFSDCDSYICFQIQFFPWGHGNTLKTHLSRFTCNFSMSGATASTSSRSSRKACLSFRHFSYRYLLLKVIRGEYVIGDFSVVAPWYSSIGSWEFSRPADHHLSAHLSYSLGTGSYRILHQLSIDYAFRP